MLFWELSLAFFLGGLFGAIGGAYVHDKDIAKAVREKGHTGFALWTDHFELTDPAPKEGEQ